MKTVFTNEEFNLTFAIDLNASSEVLKAKLSGLYNNLIDLPEMLLNS